MRAPLVGWVITGALFLSLAANAVAWPVVAALVRHFNQEAHAVRVQADSTAGKCWGPRVLSPGPR